MTLPKEIQDIMTQLKEAGFESYVVGGCVRDLMLGKQPQDWDITTNAAPEKIQEIFPDNFYENHFGTVTVKTGSEDPALTEVQVTPYRIESKYTDKRHPEEIKFTLKLEDDLSRRDFTVNSLTMDSEGNINDLFEGQEDLKNKTIRAVGNPEDRFLEDALRMMRAIRFATVLGFKIEPKTMEAIRNNAKWLKEISGERVRDELVKIISSQNAYEGVLLLKDSGLLQEFMPEILEGVGVTQNLHHIYTVWEHNLYAFKYAVDQNYSLIVRLASFLHDVGKPKTKRGDGKHSTFYGHDVVGAKMTAKILERLKFPKDISEKITKLVRYHMFYYNVGEVTDSSVRRLLMKIGAENMEDLLKLREADRIGSGTPKAVPYKLRHLQYIIDKVSRDPISVKMLKVKGEDVMKILNITPGPKIGLILNYLLSEVLEEPTKNDREYLEKRVVELNEKSAEELKAALKKIEDAQEAEEKELMKKYYV